MQSDFAAARELLECAQNCLWDRDEASRRVREALEYLIEDIAVAEFKEGPLTVVPFPRAHCRKPVPRN
jgi:hypothetical protein